MDKKKWSPVLLFSWIKDLEQTKPYRIVVKNGIGFSEILFLYGDYHYSDKIYNNEFEDSLECQKKVLDMCRTFESNMKLRSF